MLLKIFLFLIIIFNILNISQQDNKSVQQPHQDMLAKTGGGSEASLYEYTFMAILIKYERMTRSSNNKEGNGYLVCGGAIVHKQWVLTAARCFKGVTSYRDFEIFAGIVNLKNEVGQQARQIKQVAIHPKYKKPSDEYNIAMIQVSTPFKFTNHVNAGHLPTKPLSIQGIESCHILGFVKEIERKEEQETATEQRFEERLIKVQLHAIDYTECLNRFTILKRKQRYIVSAKNFCLVQIEDFPHNDSQGACEGDVGGPCVCGFKIQGIIAHQTNETCFKKGYPTTIIDVGHHLNWVRAVILQLNIIAKSSTTRLLSSSVTSLLKIIYVLFLSWNLK